MKNEKHVPHMVLRTGWQTCNIGDICFTPSMLGVLRRYFGEIRISCLAQATDERIRRLAERVCPDVSWVQDEICSKDRAPDLRISQLLGQADFFLYNSGPLFTYRGGEDYCYNSAMPLVFCQERRIPYALYAQSFELAPPADLLLQPLFSGAKAISCRDSISLAALHKAGVASATLAPDIAFAFDRCDDRAGDAFLAAEQLRPGGFLAVCSHYALEARPGVCERGQEYAAKLCAVIETWIAQTGLPVLLYPEDEREIATNQNMLFARLSTAARRKVRQRRTFWLPDEALSVLSRARAICSLEPHGMMMALGKSGVPVLHPMVWEFGVKAQLWADIGLGEWLFDLKKTDSEKIARTLLDVHNDCDGARRRAEAARMRVHGDLDRIWTRQAAEWMPIMKKTERSYTDDE